MWTNISLNKSQTKANQKGFFVPLIQINTGFCFDPPQAWPRSRQSNTSPPSPAALPVVPFTANGSAPGREWSNSIIPGCEQRCVWPQTPGWSPTVPTFSLSHLAELHAAREKWGRLLPLHGLTVIRRAWFYSRVGLRMSWGDQTFNWHLPEPLREVADRYILLPGFYQEGLPWCIFIPKSVQLFGINMHKQYTLHSNVKVWARINEEFSKNFLKKVALKALKRP